MVESSKEAVSFGRGTPVIGTALSLRTATLQNEAGSQSRFKDSCITHSRLWDLRGPVTRVQKEKTVSLPICAGTAQDKSTRVMKKRKRVKKKRRRSVPSSAGVASEEIKAWSRVQGVGFRV